MTRGTIDLVAATGGGATGGAVTLAAVAGEAPDTDSGGGPAAAVVGLLDAAFAPVVLLPVAGEPDAGPPSLLGALLVALPVGAEAPGVAVLAVSVVEAGEVATPEPVALLEVVVALPSPFPFADAPEVGAVVVAACGGCVGSGAGGGGTAGVEATGGVTAGAASGGGAPVGVVTVVATVASAAVERTSVVVSAASAFVLAAAATINARGMAASSRRP